MLGLLRYIKDCKPRLGRESESPSSMQLERLEPRVLLSADGLLIPGAPDLLEDTTQPMVQHAELLEPSDQNERESAAERQSDQQLDLTCADGTIQPILTLSVEQNNLADDGDLPVPSDADGSDRDTDDQDKHRNGERHSGHGPDTIDDARDYGQQHVQERPPSSRICEDAEKRGQERPGFGFSGGP